MAKDYKQRAHASARTKKNDSCVLPFFYGLTSGLIIMVLAWFQLIPADTPIQWPEFMGDSVKRTSVTQKAATDKPLPERPRFDFYTILPEREVLITDEESAPPASNRPAVVSRQKNTAPVPESFRLQVGSFRRASDAERQKARLALLGVESTIQKVDIGRGEMYHRVVTPVFKSKKRLNRTRQLLKKNKINSLVVRIRQSG